VFIQLSIFNVVLADHVVACTWWSLPPSQTK